MNLKLEVDCLNALTGRVIKSAKFTDASTEVIRIETQDGLVFIIDSDCKSYTDPWVTIEQVTSE